MVKVADLVTKFEDFAPKEIAVSNDPIGLQIGTLEQEIHKVLVTLDVRPEVVQEAVDNHCDMIFSHHPAMFRPIRNMDLSNPQKRMYADIIKNNITVYSAHTNLDNANNGMNDWLAKQMDLNHIQGLIHQTTYHNQDFFMGRIGQLQQPMTVLEFAKKCKKDFHINGLRLISNNPQQKVNKVAVIGGDGGKFYNMAKDNGADVFVTGDVYYHVGHDMLANHISVVDPGHHIESICKPELTKMIKNWSSQEKWQINVIESRLNTDPYQFI